MQFEIAFDQSPEYVSIRTGGEALVDGFDTLLSKLVTSPGWKTGTRQLVDHRDLIFDSFTVDDMLAIKDLVSHYSEKLGRGRCAFVINSALGYGLARMYELLGGEELHQETAVFYTITDAAEWLRR